MSAAISSAFLGPILVAIAIALGVGVACYLTCWFLHILAAIKGLEPKTLCQKIHEAMT
jgi:peroxiredoxin family protein